VHSPFLESCLALSSSPNMNSVKTLFALAAVAVSISAQAAAYDQVRFCAFTFAKCADKSSQCGGQNWTGTTLCAAGTTCTVVNPCERRTRFAHVARVLICLQTTRSARPGLRLCPPRPRRLRAG
jgi:hypothetical protein